MGIEVAKGVSLFLGAGASCDYGFPTGRQLMQDVAETLTNPKKNEIGDYLYKFSNHKAETLLEVGKDLQNAIQQRAFDSIDAFLDQRHHQSKETLEVCRQAVWCIILGYERSAQLYPEKDWMLEFFKVFFHEAKTAYGAREVWNPVVDSPRVGISIYTLNYDRLFEWKLFSYLKGRFGDSEEVAQHLAAIEGLVTHSHGSLGQITSGPCLPFGGPIPETQEAFLEVSQKLKFWFEASSNHWTWNISKLFSFRETLLILGYGYHPSINSRFDPNRSADSKLSKIYSSCFGVADAERDDHSAWVIERFAIDPESLSMGSSSARCFDIVQQLVQKKLV